MVIHPYLLIFAEWCGPCKMMPPILQQVHAQLGDKVRIIKIDVDRNQQLASELNVSSVPTIALFHKGEIKWRQPGVQPANVLVEIIKSTPLELVDLWCCDECKNSSD